MQVWRSANLALSFLLELCALGALAYWGMQTGGDLLGQVIRGLGAPLLLAILWGLIMAPRAPWRLPALVRPVLTLVLFGLAAGALATAGQPTIAALFMALTLINIAGLVLWRQEESTPPTGP